MISINNGIITMNRGDSFAMPLVINTGTKYAPEYYEINSEDKIYLGIMEKEVPWENALIRKVFDIEDAVSGNVIIKLNSTDTEFVLPGVYYYEIKLEHTYLDDSQREHKYVDTIVPRRKFIILE